MSINVPKIQINTPNGVVSTGVLHGKAQNSSASPSFQGKNLITIGDKGERIFNWLGKRSTPFNRGVIGLFAFATQPWIDLFNKDVDEDTRKAAFRRTCAKIIVGTATGITVRMLCIEAMKKFTKTTEELAKAGQKATKWNQALIPSHIKDFGKIERLVASHRNAIGTFAALLVMMITDPPLTKFMTNYFNKQKQELVAKKVAEKEVHHE